VTGAQPLSPKNWNLQSDVDIPDEQDQHYRPLPPKHSDDDGFKENIVGGFIR